MNGPTETSMYQKTGGQEEREETSKQEKKQASNRMWEGGLNGESEQGRWKEERGKNPGSKQPTNHPTKQASKKPATFGLITLSCSD